jgi:hypothetical protein
MHVHFLEPGGDTHTLCGMLVARFNVLPKHAWFQSFLPRDAERVWELATATDTGQHCKMCLQLIVEKPDVLDRRMFDVMQSHLRQARRERRTRGNDSFLDDGEDD